MLIQIIGDIIILLLVIIWIYNRDKKAKKIINEWCKKNNYDLLDIKYLVFGPLHAVFKFLRFQMYYRVKIKDGKNIKIYILKIGNYFLGLLFNEEIIIDYEEENIK